MNTVAKVIVEGQGIAGTPAGQVVSIQGVVGGVGLTVTLPSGSFTDRSGTIAAGGVSQQLAAALATRKFLLIENVSTGDLWVNFGVAAVIGQPSILIVSNGSLILDVFVSTQTVNIIGATLGQAFSAKEA